MKSESSERRLVITTGAQCRPLWLSYLFVAPSAILCAIVAAGFIKNAGSNPEEFRRFLKALPLIGLAGSVTLPVAMWRNQFTLDRGCAKLLHWWGYPFWRFGSREYDLSVFTGVEVEGVRPYWTTPKGRVTPLMVDGFANTGYRLYYDVVMVGSGGPLLLQEFHSFPAATCARRHIASFLDLPSDPEPVRRTLLGPNLHLSLYFVTMPVFMMAGLAVFFALASWIAAAGKAVLWSFGLKGYGMLVFVAGFLLFPTAGIWAGAVLWSLVPAACPLCGGKARMRWSPPWAMGLSFGRYQCGQCGVRWPLTR
ncbi:MAG: hypothetical protein HY360_24435 [Verrucomicrobia bacterium]|nr:hypothetical protein [Verrucomicrobiota bacterium]